VTSIAYAMGQSGSVGDPGAGGGFAAFIPMILIFVVFYFLLIRPQQKKAKAHQEMVSSLKKGDRVITNGGIYGLVTGLDEGTATIEIADKVRVKVTRSSIAALAQESSGASSRDVKK
jgi:preprotein translocase subunit YajC